MAEPARRQPSGDQLQRFQVALLDAYNFETLKQMLRLHLEEDLLAIVPFVNQGLKGMVHDLVVEYASRPDRRRTGRPAPGPAHGREFSQTLSQRRYTDIARPGKAGDARYGKQAQACLAVLCVFPATAMLGMVSPGLGAGADSCCRRSRRLAPRHPRQFSRAKTGRPLRYSVAKPL